MQRVFDRAGKPVQALRSAINLVLIGTLATFTLSTNAQQAPRSDGMVQRVPHNAGRLLSINTRYAIHVGDWAEARGRDFCDPKNNAYLYVVLNAAPDYKITKDWLWSDVRPAVQSAMEAECPDTNRSVLTLFYYRGIDVRRRTTTVKNLGAPMVDRQFVNTEIVFYEPARVDDIEYPLVNSAHRRGPGDQLYILGFTQDDSLGEPIAIASFSSRNGNQPYESFAPHYMAGDGSFVSYLKAKNERAQALLDRINARNADINFSVQMILGLMAASTCGENYEDWCSDAPNAISQFDLRN